MRRLLGSFYARLSSLFLLLVLALGGGAVIIAFNSAGHLFDEVEQLLNRDYARSIAAELQPLVADGFAEQRIQGAIHYMMVLNPRVEIYLLDGRGGILAYFALPGDGEVRPAVDLGPVREFVAGGGHRLVLGEDPRNTARRKPFSAAPLRMGGEQGYVYVILAGRSYDRSLDALRNSYYLRAGLITFALAVAATLLVGLSLFFLLTRRLRILSRTVGAFERGELTRRVEVRGSDEIGALGRAFNDMAVTIQAGVRSLQEAEQQRRDLVANISHDLRSPLTSIRGNLETVLLKDADLQPGERRQFLETVLKNVSGFQRLVEQLFELAKLESRQVQANREPLSISELAQDVVLKLQPQARDAGVSLEAECPQTVPLVLADVALVERLLTNLIDNALRFTPAGGEVRVRLSPEAAPADGSLRAGVRVEVSDTGSGIAPEDLPRVFDRFYRADKSRDRSTGGAGLGLAIARQIAELHAGTLEVHSVPGEGTRFRFLLGEA